MKSIRRIAALSLAAVISLTALSGCTGDEDLSGEIYIPIRQGNQVNYNTVNAYRGTILEQTVIDADFTTPYYTDLSFTMMGGTIASINVREEMDVKEGDVIATLDSESLENDIRVQELTLESARSTYEIFYDEDPDSEDTMFAEIDLAIEQAKYDDLVARLEFLEIKAPYDGKITYVGRYGAGSTIAKNATLCTIVDTSRVCLSANDNGSLGKIGFGAKVDIDQGTLVNTTGTVVDVVSEEFTGEFGGMQHSYSVNRFVIKPDEDVDFESFGTIQVTFTTLRRDDAVIVPSNAVFEFGNGYAVNVLINGVKIQTSVSVGIVSGDKTEITAGLEGNETLVLP